MAARGMGMPGMGHGDRPRRSTDSGGLGATDGKPAKKRQPGLRDVWPQLRELVLPRRKILALGFLLILLTISPTMTLVTAAAVGSFAFVLSKAFVKIRPVFRERGKITAEVTGRLTESLGGVRVVKGYHAEEREAEVFGKGVQRLLDNVFKSLTMMS